MHAQLQLEYDLLVVSAADAAKDDALFRDGTEAFEARDADEQAAALRAHRDDVSAYVAERFRISGAGSCTPTPADDITMTQQEGVPYAVLDLDYACPPSENGHEVVSSLFPDDEGYVTDTKTILTYALDLHEGSTVLDAEHPSFTTAQSPLERFWEFFRLGAEHLLTGIDHILFLLALIVGSRRLREVVIAATTFTVAHSVTFILAATGVVAAPPEIVEPTIALSIAVVGAWYLWRLWRGGKVDQDLSHAHGFLRLDRAGWLRVGWCSCSGSCTGSASPRRSGSTSRGRGRCCGRCWCSTSASRRCRSDSSSSSSRCSCCCGGGSPVSERGRARCSR